MNCKFCSNKDCDLAGVDNELNNPCPSFKHPKTKCINCNKRFDKDKATKHFKHTSMFYECPNCNELIDSKKMKD